MMVEMVGIKHIAGLTGAMASASFAVAITDHAGAIETITAAGLGGAISIVLIKWILASYNKAVDRLSKLEDERATMVKEMVEALVKVTNKLVDVAKGMGELVEASHERGTEVRDLIHELKQRPCITKDKK